MQILLHAEELVAQNERDRATMDCIWIAFYFLLRPGKYASKLAFYQHLSGLLTTPRRSDVGDEGGRHDRSRIL